MKKRVIGLDYGEKTVGVAVSDGLGLTAQGVTVIRRNNEIDVADTINQIENYMLEYDVNTLILGYPKNMNNSEGIRCEKTLHFKKQLEKRLNGVNVELFDERLSTVVAERFLLEAGLSRKKRSGIIDKMAAVQILQGYLDSNISADKA